MISSVTTIVPLQRDAHYANSEAMWYVPLPTMDGHDYNALQYMSIERYITNRQFSSDMTLTYRG
jgi:hypothetical protein